MRHQITQMKKLENGAIFKVEVEVPFETGWIERVQFLVTTFNKRDVYELHHTKNEDDKAYFEATVKLENSAMYQYYFSFVVNGRLQYYKKQNITGNTSITREECWKMSALEQKRRKH